MWQFLRDLAIEISFICPKYYKLFYYKDTCIYVCCNTVYDSKDSEPTECPSMIDWIKKMWHIYTMEYYAAIEKDECMSFAGKWRSWKPSFSAN